MAIKNVTTIYRPQRSGKIHLGLKVKKRTKDNRDVEYPSEVNFFVLRDAPDLIPFYGPDPTDAKNPEAVHKELQVTLPSARFNREDFDAYLDRVFPQWMKRYGSAGLYCKGDGETAVCLNEKTGAMEERECPCEFIEKGDCKRIGILRIRDQHIPSFNIFQITTGSFNSIVNINSFIRDLAEYCLVNGIDISNVKLVLTRNEEEVSRLEGGKMHKSRHHIMRMDLDPRFYKNLDDVRTRALPQTKAVPLALPAADESRDDLLYPKDGFAPPEEGVGNGAIHGAKAGASTIDDIPEADNNFATLEQLADIATMTEALKERGKAEKSISAEMVRVLKQKHGIDYDVKKDLTVEEAATSVSFLKGWLINIDERRKAEL